MNYIAAEKCDIEDVVNIRMDYFSEYYQSITERQLLELRSSLQTYMEQHLGIDCFAFLAKEGEIVQSTALLIVMDKPPNLQHPTGKTGEILGVYTEKEYRRRGLAAKLIQMAMEAGANKGLSYLDLDASEYGFHLYQKLGFQCLNTEYVSMRYQY